jgi:hypothetical protein
MTTLTAPMVAEALRAAGHAEAGESRNVGITIATTGFGTYAGGRKVVVCAHLGDDLGQSYNPEAPGAKAAEARMVAEYLTALEAAGFGVTARNSLVLDVTSAPKAKA